MWLASFLPPAPIPAPPWILYEGIGFEKACSRGLSPSDETLAFERYYFLHEILPTFVWKKGLNEFLRRFVLKKNINLI